MSAASHPLEGGSDLPLERRWVTIPPGTWHRLFAGERPWGMLSFHTVQAPELIEERPRDADDLDGPTTRERYQPD